MAASGEKPYRVYKGGRTKGKVPLPTKERQTERPARTTYRSGGSSGDGRPVIRRQRKGWTWKRWTWVTLLVLVVLLIVWSVAGFLSVRTGVKDANGRLQVGADSVLAKQNSLLLSSGTNILLLGTDHSTNGQNGRSSDQHSDSMMLLHTDPGRHRLVYLSIPRDLRPAAPGYGAAQEKRGAQPRGADASAHDPGALLWARPTDNHVVVIDMSSFMKLVDAVGGIDVNVPAPILSNRFDCPFSSSSRC